MGALENTFIGQKLGELNQLVNPPTTPPSIAGQQMPQMPQAPIDRYLPLMSGIGAGLATPSALQGGSTAMGIGNAIQGYAQGRAFQNQAQRQMYQPYIEAMAQRAIIEQQAQSMEQQAAAMEATGDTKGAEAMRKGAQATRLGQAAAYVVPKPARPKTAAELRELKARIGKEEAQAKKYIAEAKRGPTGTTPAERAGKEERTSFSKAVAHISTAYNAEMRNAAAQYKDVIPKDKWYSTDNGRAALSEAAAMASVSVAKMKQRLHVPVRLNDAQAQAIESAPDGETFTLEGEQYIKQQGQLVPLE